MWVTSGRFSQLLFRGRDEIRLHIFLRHFVPATNPLYRLISQMSLVFIFPFHGCVFRDACLRTPRREGLELERVRVCGLQNQKGGKSLIQKSMEDVYSAAARDRCRGGTTYKKRELGWPAGIDTNLHLYMYTTDVFTFLLLFLRASSCPEFSHLALEIRKVRILFRQRMDLDGNIGLAGGIKRIRLENKVEKIPLSDAIQT